MIEGWRRLTGIRETENRQEWQETTASVGMLWGEPVKILHLHKKRQTPLLFLYHIGKLCTSQHLNDNTITGHDKNAEMQTEVKKGGLLPIL